MEYIKGQLTKLSSNFISTEFDCRCRNCTCTKTKISKDLINYLQRIRDHFNKPIVISSGYRCSAHNKAIGGAASSKHCQGMAADIVVKDIEPREVAAYAESIGVKGVGLYETAADGYFTHIDTRLTKAFWYGQRKEYRTTFIEGAVSKELASQEQNIVKEWQLAAIADGFSFPTFGADGSFGAECVRVAKSAVIQRGSKSSNLIKFIQRRLGADVDGICGYKTEAAIKQFQKQKGLKPDGKAGYNTWKAILNVK